jgi:hypothetical protein
VYESESKEAIFLCFSNICEHISPFAFIICSVSSLSRFVSDFAAKIKKEGWENIDDQISLNNLNQKLV